MATKRLDPDLIQSFRFLKRKTVQNFGSVRAGKIVDRDADWPLFNAILKAGIPYSTEGDGPYHDASTPLVVESLTSNRSFVEVWVRPSGSDHNPGTRDAPFATITAATDYVQENFSDEAIKVVHVGPGVYNNEEIVIHKPFVELVGAGPNFFDQIVHVSLENQGPALSVTNMTRGSWQDFIDEGGVDYTDDGTSFAYTGAQVTGRETTFEHQSNVVIKNIMFRQDPTDEVAKPPVVVITSGAAVFERVGVYQLGDATHAAIYIKNSTPTFNGCTIVSTMVCDNADKINFQDFGSIMTTVVVGRVVVRQGGGDYGFEGSGVNGQTLGSSFVSQIPTGLLRVYKDSGSHELHTSRGDASVFVRGDIELNGTVNLTARSLQAKSLTVTGVSACNIGHLVISEDVALSGPHTYKVDGGAIRGSLTLLDGASINLTGVHVLGDVDLTGVGDVTWRGGSFYGTLTDPENKLGGASAGDYLNVTP